MMHLRGLVFFTAFLPGAGRRSTRIADTKLIAETKLLPQKWLRAAPVGQIRHGHLANRRVKNPIFTDSRLATLDARGRPAVMGEEEEPPPKDNNKVSPFEDPSARAAANADGTLPLTMDNVEMVLDEMRPYLLADGGNVVTRSIDGGIVKLEMQGACSTCPSSTMTLKMGLERGLREKIPEIVAVEQTIPDGAELDELGIEVVLDEIRPFLKMAGGAIEVVDLRADGVAPTATIRMTGAATLLTTIRAEVVQRLKRKFPTLVNVVFAD